MSQYQTFAGVWRRRSMRCPRSRRGMIFFPFFAHRPRLASRRAHSIMFLRSHPQTDIVMSCRLIRFEPPSMLPLQRFIFTSNLESHLYVGKDSILLAPGECVLTVTGLDSAGSTVLSKSLYNELVVNLRSNACILVCIISPNALDSFICSAGRKCSVASATP